MQRVSAQPVDNYLQHNTNGDKSSYGGGGVAIGGGIADLKSGYGGAPKGKMRGSTSERTSDVQKRLMMIVKTRRFDDPLVGMTILALWLIAS